MADDGVTVEDVMEYWFISQDTVYVWIALGRFPHARRVGRRWRIPRSEMINPAEIKIPPARTEETKK